MDTVYDKSYIEHDQINSDAAKTPQFSTNSNEFDVNLTQCKNDFLCLNDKSQAIFLQKLVNSDVSVGNNTVIGGLFDKYCLGLGIEEKKMLAEDLTQARAKNSYTNAPVINVAKRNVVHHNKVPKKVANKQIEHASGNATLYHTVKVAVVLGAVTGAILCMKKLYNGLIVGGIDGNKVNGVNMGWLSIAYRNITDNIFNTELVKKSKNKAAAALIASDHCDVKIEGNNVCNIAKSVDSQDKLKSFLGKLEEVNKAADQRGFLGKMFKSAPAPLFNISEKKEIIKKIDKQNESVKDSHLYKFASKLAANYGIVPSKQSKFERFAQITGSLAFISQIVKPVSPFLNLIPYVGTGLCFIINALNSSSGQISQFMKQMQSND